MGVSTIKWAKALRVGSPTRKLVLLVIAEYVTDGEWSMWAGQETIATEAELSTRTVGRVLAELEDLGVLSREQRRRRDGYRTSDLVRLNPDWEPPSPDTESGDTESGDSESPDSDDDLTRQPVQPHPTQCQGIDEPLVEPLGEPGDIVGGADYCDERPDVDSLCALLAERVGQHRDSPRPPVTARWRNDMRLLIDRGPLDQATPTPLDPERIEKAIRFLFDRMADTNGRGFCWADQVRSPHALRKHWHPMAAAARKVGRPHTKGRTPPTAEDAAALAEKVMGLA